MATSQSPGLPEALVTAYNPGMCLFALPVISAGFYGILRKLSCTFSGECVILGTKKEGIAFPENQEKGRQGFKPNRL